MLQSRQVNLPGGTAPAAPGVPENGDGWPRRGSGAERPALKSAPCLTRHAQPLPQRAVRGPHLRLPHSNPPSPLGAVPPLSTSSRSREAALSCVLVTPPGTQGWGTPLRSLFLSLQVEASHLLVGKEGGLGNTGALENLPWEGQQWDGPRGASHPGARVLVFCVSDGGRSFSRRSSYVFKGKVLKPMLGRRVQ